MTNIKKEPTGRGLGEPSSTIRSATRAGKQTPQNVIMIVTTRTVKLRGASGKVLTLDPTKCCPNKGESKNQTTDLKSGEKRFHFGLQQCHSYTSRTSLREAVCRLSIFSGCCQRMRTANTVTRAHNAMTDWSPVIELSCCVNVLRVSTVCSGCFFL